jgi:hypothetical protein
MGMLGALRFTAFVKFLDATLELLLFPGKIPFIGNHKLLVRGGILGKRLVAGEGRTNEWTEYPADQHPGQNEATGSHVEGRGAVRHHLRDIHFAPLVLGRELQLVDAGDHFRDRFGLKQILHF